MRQARVLPVPVFGRRWPRRRSSRRQPAMVPNADAEQPGRLPAGHPVGQRRHHPLPEFHGKRFAHIRSVLLAGGGKI